MVHTNLTLFILVAGCASTSGESIQVITESVVEQTPELIRASEESQHAGKIPPPAAGHCKLDSHETWIRNGEREVGTLFEKGLISTARRDWIPIESWTFVDSQMLRKAASPEGVLSYESDISPLAPCFFEIRSGRRFHESFLWGPDGMFYSAGNGLVGYKAADGRHVIVAGSMMRRIYVFGRESPQTGQQELGGCEQHSFRGDRWSVSHCVLELQIHGQRGTLHDPIMKRDVEFRVDGLLFLAGDSRGSWVRTTTSKAAQALEGASKLLADYDLERNQGGISKFDE